MGPRLSVAGGGGAAGMWLGTGAGHASAAAPAELGTSESAVTAEATIKRLRYGSVRIIITSDTNAAVKKRDDSESIVIALLTLPFEHDLRANAVRVCQLRESRCQRCADAGPSSPHP